MLRNSQKLVAGSEVLPQDAFTHKTGPDKRALEDEISLLCSVMVAAKMTELFSTLLLLQEQLLVIAPRRSMLAILDRLDLSSW